MKPRPPKDLWEQMDAVRESCGLVEQPSNAFTTNDYAERYGMSQNLAYKEIQRMVSKGKIRRVENCKKHCYVVVQP